MAGDDKTSSSGQGISRIRPNLRSEYYRERNADGTFPPRTEAQEQDLKAEVAKWAALMGLKPA
ncbi:MAG: hypothetical protein AAB927_03665 [Patescibacteria group bacterium]